MKLKSLILFGLLGLSFIFMPSFSVVQAYEDAGLTKVLKNSGSAGTVLKNMGSPEDKITSIIGTILSFVGVAFLILMIYGGILWMTSQGNDTQIKKAKGILINGIIGLIIVVLAYAITAYVGNTLTGSDSTTNPSVVPEN